MKLFNLFKDIDDDIDLTFFENADDDIECDDESVLTNEQIQIAKELKDLFLELISNEDNLNEEFISGKTLTTHFNKHCLAGLSKNSSKTNVFYDFNNEHKYMNYEELISNTILNSPKTMIIYSLYDTEKCLKYFRKLFEGDKAIQIARSCELTNSKGAISIGLYAYSKYTNNYKTANAIDLIIFGNNNKTISMYAVDAYYLETKLNNILHKYSKFKDTLKFNND